MSKKNKILKAAIVIAIALAFLLPGAAIAGNINTMHIKNTQSPAPTRDGGWVEQASGFYEQSIGINYLDAIDENVSWAVGYDGAPGSGMYKTWFTKTSNGGELWEADTVFSTENYGLGNICGIDGDTAWTAVFYSAGNQNDDCGIYNTSDGGNTWNHQEGPLQGSASFANNVFFWDEDNGMCQGDLRDEYFEVYTTNNGGVDWTRVPEVDFTGDAPVSGEAGWTGCINVIGDTVTFGTNKGNIWKSDDRGYTWTVSYTGMPSGGLNEGVNEIAFKDENYGLAAHDNDISYDLYVTSNGGDDWEQITPTGFVYAAGLSYVPGTDNMFISTGAAEGSSGASYSVDGGHTWVDYSEMIGTQMLSCDFVEGGIGWAGAFSVDELTGGMWKYTPGEPEPNFDFSFGDESGLTVTIKNVGTAEATNIAYTIVIEGGLIILPPKEFSDTIPSIPSGDSKDILLEPKGFGLGIITPMPKATVNVTCDEGASAEDSAEFRLILSKVILQ